MTVPLFLPAMHSLPGPLALRRRVPARQGPVLGRAPRVLELRPAHGKPHREQDKPRRAHVKARRTSGVPLRPIRVPAKLELPRRVRDVRGKARMRARAGGSHASFNRPSAPSASTIPETSATRQ